MVSNRADAIGYTVILLRKYGKLLALLVLLGQQTRAVVGVPDTTPRLDPSPIHSSTSDPFARCRKMEGWVKGD